LKGNVWLDDNFSTQCLTFGVVSNQVPRTPPGCDYSEILLY